uniref:Uncharacterized protein n=1 Tax=Rhizophora mucronata TaxID=61149 RepID=A0A2P2R2U4_RHIMU
MACLIPGLQNNFTRPFYSTSSYVL